MDGAFSCRRPTVSGYMYYSTVGILHSSVHSVRVLSVAR